MLATRPCCGTSEDRWGLRATCPACFLESSFYPNRRYELSLSFIGGQHLCCCCWKRAIHGAVLANLATCFFSPLGCAQYSVWIWEDLSAFLLCREAVRNEAMDLSYTIAWKNRPWPNKSWELHGYLPESSWLETGGQVETPSDRFCTNCPLS